MAEHTPLTEIGEADLTDAFRYLDVLRESGVTNMYAATPYVIRDCGMKRPVAIAVNCWCFQSTPRRLRHDLLPTHPRRARFHYLHKAVSVG